MTGFSCTDTVTGDYYLILLVSNTVQEHTTTNKSCINENIFLLNKNKIWCNHMKLGICASDYFVHNFRSKNSEPNITRGSLNAQTSYISP